MRPPEAPAFGRPSREKGPKRRGSRAAAGRPACRLAGPLIAALRNGPAAPSRGRDRGVGWVDGRCVVVVGEGRPGRRPWRRPGPPLPAGSSHSQGGGRGAPPMRRRTRYLPPERRAGREGRRAVLGRKGQRVRGDEGRGGGPRPGMPCDRRAALAGQRAPPLPVRPRDGPAGRVDGRAARAKACGHGRHGRPARRRGGRPGRGGARARRGGGRPRRAAQRVPEAGVWARVRHGGDRGARAGVGGARRGGPAGADVLRSGPACRRREVCSDCCRRRRARPRVARPGGRRGGRRRARGPLAQARARPRL